MKLARRQFLRLAAGAAVLPAVSRIAWAQAYPTRPVRIIVAAAAGGGTDIAARLIGQSLSERLGRSFLIENRPGGNNNIGTEAVVRAPADGYCSSSRQCWVTETGIGVCAPVPYDRAHRRYRRLKERRR
jgi:tripartite-type tricarboxylate transporter receptor subunit TctC